jgi:hypothetical protein
MLFVAVLDRESKTTPETGCVALGQKLAAIRRERGIPAPASPQRIGYFGGSRRPFDSVPNRMTRPFPFRPPKESCSPHPDAFSVATALSEANCIPVVVIYEPALAASPAVDCSQNSFLEELMWLSTSNSAGSGAVFSC